MSEAACVASFAACARSFVFSFAAARSLSLFLNCASNSGGAGFAAVGVGSTAPAPAGPAMISGRRKRRRRKRFASITQLEMLSRIMSCRNHFVSSWYIPFHWGGGSIASSRHLFARSALGLSCISSRRAVKRRSASPNAPAW